MSQKNKQQLLQEKEKLEADKAKLETIKANQPDKWTEAMQVKLDEFIGELADINDELSAMLNDEKPEYTPKTGTEKLVHLSIVRGRRFNSATGEEETKPFTQMFTFAEWQLFKKNHSKLGYTIMAVLHNPYEE